MNYYWSIALNILLILAFIIDRIFRINSLKEYKEAKEATIKLLSTQVETLKEHYDDFIAKKQQDDIKKLKKILSEKEEEINFNNTEVLNVKAQLSSITVKSDEFLKQNLILENKLFAIENENGLISTEAEYLRNILADKNKNIEKLEFVTYSLSHQFRAPIATLMGLINLLEFEDINKEEILPHLKRAAEGLDRAIKNFTSENF